MTLCGEHTFLGWTPHKITGDKCEWCEVGVAFKGAQCLMITEWGSVYRWVGSRGRGKEGRKRDEKCPQRIKCQLSPIQKYEWHNPTPVVV